MNQQVRSTNSFCHVLHQPFSQDETGSMWHAQNKLGLTVYGLVAVLPSAKNANKHETVHILLTSEVLDHDTQMANLLLDRCIEVLQAHPAVAWTKIAKLFLLADCGPHFRSRESMAHYLFTLPKKLQVIVVATWLGEAHGKSAVDRLFGWSRGWVKRFLDTLKSEARLPNGKQEHMTIFGQADLLTAYKDGSAAMAAADSEGGCFVIESYDPGPSRPGTRWFLHSPTLYITRTYCMVAKEDATRPRGILLLDHVFSDHTVGKEFDWTIYEEVKEETDEWRRGFYTQARSWEAPPPEPGHVNEIVRRHMGQKQFPPPATSEVLEDPIARKFRSKVLSMNKAAAKKKRQRAALKVESDSDSESSSSGSSSDSSSSGGDPS